MNPSVSSSSKPQDIPLDQDVSVKGAVDRARKAALKKHGKQSSGGLTIARLFTTPGSDPLEQVKYEKRTSRISNTDGSVVFEMKDAEVPAAWSQVATDIVVSKYFRKAGVPLRDAHGELLRDEKGAVLTGPESSVKQVIKRLAGCWRYWAENYNYFDTHQDAQAFEDEISYMLVHQMSAPNSPQWFNTGLHHAYGITGKAQGHYYCDPESGEVRQSDDAYTHPQPHACFIQSVEDDMVNEGGIMDLWVREARLFKYGSGTGTNFSRLRGAGEPLSGGGQTSGLMSFLKVGDRAAGAIKSGGTTRRAAKMVCLDVDHPDIIEFVTWKVNEEKKVAALAKAGFSTDFNGEAYATVSGQNSNNSIRVTHDFLKAVERDEPWHLYWRTELKTAKEENRPPKPCRTLKARELWDQVAYAAWACADPGVQYDSTINDWHTCPSDGRINASNPCSEYMFLDNTACNLASINLLTLLKTDDATGERSFDIEGFRHAVRLWTIVLEISVLMAQFPSKEIAELSYRFRTLGLGYANLGAMLMQMGIPYDSEQGRALCACITAILTGESYAMSAEMASVLSPFEGYDNNREHMLRVIRNHRRAAYGAPDHEYEELCVVPVGINQRIAPVNLRKAAQEAWDKALDLGQKHGYRNAQTTVIAPTGTIGLLMDCDTTGVEPDFALVKFKKLAGGGYMKIANQSIAPALKALRYSDEDMRDIMRFVMGTLSLEGAPHINRQTLKAKGFTDSDIASVEKTLPQVFELSFAFNRWTLGDETLKRLGFTDAEREDPSLNVLRALGFTSEHIEEANVHICGHMTVEGAPHLKPEHLPVFDCANRCGKTGKRFIHADGHIRMMAAAQPFISGAISKTINLPNEATIEDFKNAYNLSWKLGIKANALYRDGSKMSQALSNKSDTEEKKGEEPTVIEKIVLKEVPRRKKLPDERMSITHKLVVAGHEAYVHVGLYEDGTPGEIFIKMSKEGSTLSGVMDTLALSLSMNLQYGVPLEVICEKLVNTRFEPMGMTSNREIPMVKSIMDYLGRWLALKFLTREKAARYHSKDLIDKAYESGSRSREAFAMRLPVVDEGDSPLVLQPAIDDSAPSDLEHAKLQGYTGSVCSGCGSTKMKRNGSCELCLDCGATSGCS